MEAQRRPARESTVNPLAAAMEAKKRPARESTVNPLASVRKRAARESTVNPLAAAMNRSRKSASIRKKSVLARKSTRKDNNKLKRDSIMKALSNSSPQSIPPKRNSSVIYSPPPQPVKANANKSIKSGLSPAMKFVRKMSVFLGPEDAEDLFLQLWKKSIVKSNAT